MDLESGNRNEGGTFGCGGRWGQGEENNKNEATNFRNNIIKEKSGKGQGKKHEKWKEYREEKKGKKKWRKN